MFAYVKHIRECVPLRNVLRCFKTFFVHPMMRHIFANAPILNCRLVLTLNHKLFRSACVCLCLYVFVCMCLSVCVRCLCVCLFVCVFHVRVYVRVYVCALCVDQIGGWCSWSTSSVLCAQCQVPCSMRLSDHLCVFSVMSLPQMRCAHVIYAMLTKHTLGFIGLFSFSLWVLRVYPTDHSDLRSVISQHVL